MTPSTSSSRQMHLCTKWTVRSHRSTHLRRTGNRTAVQIWCPRRNSPETRSLIYRQLRSIRLRERIASLLHQKTPPVLTRRKTWVRTLANLEKRRSQGRRPPRMPSTTPHPRSQTTHPVIQSGIHLQRPWQVINDFDNPHPHPNSISIIHIIMTLNHLRTPLTTAVCRMSKVSCERGPEMTQGERRSPVSLRYWTKTACHPT